VDLDSTDASGTVEKQKMKGLLTIFIWLIVASLSAQPAAPIPSNPGGAPGSDLSPTNGLPLSGETRTLIQQLESDLEQLQPLLALTRAAPGGPENPPIGIGFNPFYPGVPPHPVPNAGRLLAGNFGQNFGVNYSQNFSTLNSVTPPGVTPMPPADVNSPFLPFVFSSPAAPPNPSAAPTPTGNAAPNAPLGTNELILLNNLELVLQDVQANVQELLPRLDRLAASGGATANGPGGTGLNNPGANGFAAPLNGQFATPLSNQFATPLSNGFTRPLTNRGGQLR
jgi:hypothetical protein